MKLPIPFLNLEKGDNRYYLVLLLEDEKASSVILEESLGKVKVVGKHTEHLSAPLETIPQSDLINLVDKVVSRAEEVLPPDIETHKTIFGVKDNWVEKETKKIKKEYLAKLKKVCDALDMTPIGFMVISEAIANLLQIEEGAPLSAVLIELSNNSAALTLFRGGKISEATSAALVHKTPEEIDTFLKTFTAAVLPSKIIVSHTLSTKELATHLHNHEWSKSLPFLHVPQVVILPENFDAKAVTFGAAQQMGFELMGLTDIPKQSEKKKTVAEIPVENTKPETPEKEDETEEPVPPLPTSISDNFGFVTDEDIAKHKVTKPQVEVTKSLREEANTEELTKLNLGEETPADDLTEVTDQQAQSEKKNSKNMLANFANFLPSLPKLKIPKMPEFLTQNKGLKLPLIAAGFIVLFIILLSIFYFYAVKAQLILSVKPKSVNQDQTVIFSTTAPSDFSKNIIAAKSISTSVDGQLSTDATGKKDTGIKAKGSVTVYNSSDSEQSLGANTVIKSSNGMAFTLDKDVTIASASGDIFSGTKPGTATVAVTAQNFGTESNLPSGTTFTVGGNSNLAAKNDSAFSGGTKKTVTVVSKDDIAKLKSDLPKSLEKRAQDELSNKLSSDETVLPGFINESLDKAKFDKGVDDEAKQVTITATVNFQGVSYQNSDLKNFDGSVLKDHFSQDINLANNSLRNDVKNVKAKNDKEVQATVSITAGLLPKIDSSSVVAKIKGMSPNIAQETVQSLPQVTGSKIKFSPNIFFLSSLFPRLPKNVSVVVKPE